MADRAGLIQSVHSHMQKVPWLKKYCDRCLKTERYGGNVALMVIDASFMSLGLNYFTAVVPAVLKIRELMPELDLEKLRDIEVEEVRYLWKNRRSWDVARNVAEHFCQVKEYKKCDDRRALRIWASNSKLDEWKKDPIGSIKGVGINTYQYLRMMGGIDTVMPDRIVKRVINDILTRSGYEAVEDDMAFIRKVHEIAQMTGYRAIELCWMTWLVQYEGKNLRAEKYRSVMDLI
jgi:hypothetical protein